MPIIKHAYLFPPSKPKLTRIHPYTNPFAYENEKNLASIFRRPMRSFEEDPPFYPWIPPEPLVNVNFKLNFKE